MWSVSTILIGLASFMYDTQHTTGGAACLSPTVTHHSGEVQTPGVGAVQCAIQTFERHTEMQAQSPQAKRTSRGLHASR